MTAAGRRESAVAGCCSLAPPGRGRGCVGDEAFKVPRHPEVAGRECVKLE